jgi:hypothetical protein
MQVIILLNRIAIPPVEFHKNPGEYPRGFISTLHSFIVQMNDEHGYFAAFARFLSSTFIITRIA